MAALSLSFSWVSGTHRLVRTRNVTLARAELIYGFHKMLIKKQQDALYLTSNSEK